MVREQVQAAFQNFLDSPKASYACENQEEDAKVQRSTADYFDRLLSLPPAGTSRRVLADARRVAVPVECTLATYQECFKGDGWMGQMLLEGVVNIPYERYFVPLQVPDRATLIDCVMMHARIFNLHVQQASRLILLRHSSPDATTTHRFSEASLCKPVAEYEAAGLPFMHSAQRML